MDLYGKRDLHDRERRIVKYVAEGLTNQQIAMLIGSTEHVVKNYLGVIYDKTGVWSRLELALWSLEHKTEIELNVASSATTSARSI